MADHVFISNSTADALGCARKFADGLEGGKDDFIDVWFDKDDIDPTRDWDDQLVEGIKSCQCLAFVVTKDSNAPGTMCKNERKIAPRAGILNSVLRLFDELAKCDPNGLLEGVREAVEERFKLLKQRLEPENENLSNAER